MVADTGFPLDTAGALETPTPTPTPKKPRILREVVEPEQVFPKRGPRLRVEGIRRSVV